jgi:hypothetical protein
MPIIRKISIGKEYKDNAMHYSVGQNVYGGHCVHAIVSDNTLGTYKVYIKKKNDIILWKEFNKNMAISIEYILEY